MFNNLVNADDVLRLVEKLRQGYGARLTRMLSPRQTARTQAAWQHVAHPPKHWGSIPAIRARWNEKITGDTTLAPPAYVAQEHFDGRLDLKALSVGCGTGRNEIRWARTGAFARIDGYDLSEQRIAKARRYAEAEGFSDVAFFHAADVRALELTPASYDVVLAENALHHFTPLEEVIISLKAVLKPGGLLIVRDFVGPSRFQWTPEQVQAVDNLLALLPEAYRARWGSGTVKRRFYRPGRLSMILSDPSEAAESANILPLLDTHFDLVERRDFGGTVLQLLFDDIAHHFLGDDEKTQRLLDLCFQAEDTLLASGALPSDFVFAVYRKPGS